MIMIITIMIIIAIAIAIIVIIIICHSLGWGFCLLLASVENCAQKLSTTRNLQEPRNQLQHSNGFSLSLSGLCFLAWVLAWVLLVSAGFSRFQLASARKPKTTGELDRPKLVQIQPNLTTPKLDIVKQRT